MTDDLAERVRSLEHRVARERGARLEAERIAEHSTRELYDRQQELGLLAAVATAANRSRTPEEALSLVLPEFCRHIGWPLAQAWLLDVGSGELRCAAARHVEEETPYRDFLDGSRRRRLNSGEGLPGRVLEQGEPVWIRDVGVAENFPRRAEAREAGLRSGLALPIALVSGEVVGVIECFCDAIIEPTAAELALGVRVGELLAQVFERVHHDERLRHEAYHDAVTGLPNRSLFKERLDFALSLARRSDLGIAVAMLDLDRFKEVNDTLGHEQGDRLLVEVGRRLAAALGESDTIARFGGDEFGLVLSRVRVAEDAAAVALRIAGSLRKPIHLDGVPIGVTASIGIALHPEHGGNASELIRRADIAMYEAKRTQSRHALYARALDSHTSERLALAADLRAAIDAGDLSVHYQPKVAVPGRELVGVEALVRWSHPVRGMLAPVEFIPLAERTGLMGALTSHVLRSSLAQAQRWLADGLEVGVAINVAPLSLLDRCFPDEVRRALQDSGVPARLLELEVTESSVLEDPRRARRTLDDLGAMGVSIALDDFGTGFSSLGQLKELPVGTLKIDRSFVAGMSADARDAFIVRAAIRLGHDLGMAIVAEGVEDEATFALLSELGCDAIQGYLIHRPADAETLSAWLRAVPATAEA